MNYHVSVPTSTVIGIKPENKFLVLMIRPTDKHEGKLVLPGGRWKIGQQVGHNAAVSEWFEEVGGEGSTIEEESLFLLGVASDPNRDIREILFSKFQHLPPEEVKNDFLVTAHYGCPDSIYIAHVLGEPHPNDGEAKECQWVDIRKVDQGEIGAGHDVVVQGYLEFLLSGKRQLPDFSDFTKFRRKRQR